MDIFILLRCIIYAENVRKVFERNFGFVNILIKIFTITPKTLKYEKYNFIHRPTQIVSKRVLCYLSRAWQNNIMQTYELTRALLISGEEDNSKF